MFSNTSYIFLSTLKVTEGHITIGLENTTIDLSELLKTSVQDVKSGILSETAQLGKVQQSIGDSLAKLSLYVELITEESKVGSTQTVSLCKEMIERVAMLDKDIKDQNKTIASIDDLRTKNNVLNAQCETLTRSLGIKDDEVSALQEEIKVSAEQIRTVELAREEVCEEMKKMESQLESKTSAVKTAEEKAKKCKSSCDSKLRTQSELYKMVTTEVEKARKELEESRTRVLELQNELTDKHSSDLELKKLEKANTKLVAEKDKIISDIESEKDTLKKEIEELRAIFEQYQNQSATNEFTVAETIRKTVLGDDPKTKHAASVSKSINGKEITEKSTEMSTQKPKRGTKTKKYTKPLHKRKLLDGDTDDELIFDDFELDDVLLDDSPMIPKRYIKRKKTKQY